MKIEKILLIILYIGLGLMIIYLNRSREVVDEKIEESKESIKAIEQIALHDIKEVAGQEIYVPAYSNIKSFDGKSKINISVNLSVRNTDVNRPIVIQYLDYYNSSGMKSKAFLDSPVRLKPMATLDFHITQADTIGGSGANFYLKWSADTIVHEPIVEAIMVGSSGTLGFSWSSKGHVVKTSD